MPQERDEQTMRELLGQLTRDFKHEVEEANKEILSVVRLMAGKLGRYKRERNASLKANVSEVYSAPRTTAAIRFLPDL